MTTAELIKPKIRLVPQCYFCKKIVGDEQFCYGCREFICDSCDWISPVGEHDVKQHQEVEDD